MKYILTLSADANDPKFAFLSNGDALDYAIDIVKQTFEEQGFDMRAIALTIGHDASDYITRSWYRDDCLEYGNDFLEK